MVQFKLLADGQLPSSKGTLYTGPTNVRTLIKCITLCNTHSTDARTVNLYVSRGTSRRIIDVDKSIAGKASYVFSEPIVIGPTELLEGDASAATSVDYSVHGVQES